MIDRIWQRTAVTLSSACIAAVSLTGAPAAAQDQEMTELMNEGRTLYAEVCSACHGASGQGTGSGPALDGNTSVESRSGLINQILWGATEHGMPPFAPMLTDREIAAVATYVRNSWSNDYGPVLDRSVTLRR
jgi:mono/diheme cytochrome c family protein